MDNLFNSKLSLLIQSVSRTWIKEASCLFLSWFWPALNQASFLEAARAVV